MKSNSSIFQGPGTPQSSPMPVSATESEEDGDIKENKGQFLDTVQLQAKPKEETPSPPRDGSATTAATTETSRGMTRCIIVHTVPVNMVTRIFDIFFFGVNSCVL